MVELGSLGAEHTDARFFGKKRWKVVAALLIILRKPAPSMMDSVRFFSRQRQRRACEARSFHGLEGLKFGSRYCFDSEIWSASSSLGYALKG